MHEDIYISSRLNLNLWISDQTKMGGSMILGGFDYKEKGCEQLLSFMQILNCYLFYFFISIVS